MRRQFLWGLVIAVGAGLTYPVHALTTCYKKPLSLDYKPPKETSPPPKVYKNRWAPKEKNQDAHLHNRRGLPPERYGINEERSRYGTGIGDNGYHSYAPADTMAGAAARSSSGVGSASKWMR